MAIKYELIHKLLREVEKRADAEGYDIDNTAIYKDVHRLLADIECDGYKPTTAERRQLREDLVTLCEVFNIGYMRLVGILF